MGRFHLNTNSNSSLRRQNHKFHGNKLEITINTEDVEACRYFEENFPITGTILPSHATCTDSLESLLWRILAVLKPRGTNTQSELSWSPHLIVLYTVTHWLSLRTAVYVAFTPPTDVTVTLTLLLRFTALFAFT